MRKLTCLGFVLAMALGFSTAASAICIQQNDDSGGCRASGSCGGGWDDCDPEVRHCPDMQFP